MEKKICFCNNCGKGTEDYMNEKGWIRIDEYGLHIYNGRDENEQAVSERYFNELRITSYETTLDFCSLKCFVEWLYLSDETDNYKGDSKRMNEQKERFFKENLKSLKNI